MKQTYLKEIFPSMFFYILPVESAEKSSEMKRKDFKFKCHMCKFGTNQDLQDLRNHLNEIHPTKEL